MNPKDISKAILSIAPDSEFTFQECDLDSLIWHSKTAKPSKEAILLAIEENASKEAAALAAKATAKSALLEKLGITAEEVKLLLS